MRIAGPYSSGEPAGRAGMSQEGKGGKDVSLAGLLNCPKCGRGNPSGARYCEGCGASLAGVTPSHGQAETKTRRRLGGLLGRKDRAA